MPDDDPSRGPEGPRTPDVGEAGALPAEAAAAPAPPEAEKGLEEVVDPAGAQAYHQRARLAEDRLEEVLAAYRQLKADNESFRERTTRNLERRFDQRRESLLLKFIDILDNLDRALEAAQTAYVDPSLLEGLILVRTQLLQTLQEEGLERIPVLGLAFDPHVSEAVATERVEDPDQDQIVIRELLRGYRLNGRVARASQVVLGEYLGEAGAGVAPPQRAAGEGAQGASSLDEIIERAGSHDDPAPVKGARGLKPGKK